MYKPLADEIRPKSLDDVVGQRHILGRDGMLRRIVESGQIPNMIFYGPSGTGKTTVARIIAERTNRTLRKLNATHAGISGFSSARKQIKAAQTKSLSANGSINFPKLVIKWYLRAIFPSGVLLP